MKTILALALALSSVSAMAAIESTDLTCQEIRSAVSRNGWQIIQTNGQPSGNKAAYAKVYADFSGLDNPVTVWVKSSSGKACPAGYVDANRDFHGTATNLNYRSWL